MNFTTPVSIEKIPNPIRYGDGIFMIGSCFTENIGGKLRDHGYSLMMNPAGILFNPASIDRTIADISSQKQYKEADLVKGELKFHSLHHHGRFSKPDKEATLSQINDELKTAYTFLSQAKFVFISPGTAGCFRLKSSGEIVANCHKLPADLFERFRLSYDACKEHMKNISNSIRLLNPAIQIHWTISPVKYLREGILENQRSKSTLILALDQHLREMTDEHYFPAYEILQDELRDYRYYAADMAHPSPLAIDYIWERFGDAYLGETERRYHPAINKILRARDHVITSGDNEQIRTFANGQLKALDEIASQLPEGNWQPLRQYFYHLTELD